MNRIWVGTVDDIDNTHVELKAKKFGCPAPLIKADDPVQLKTLDNSDTHRTRQSGGSIRAATADSLQKPRGRDFRW